MNFWLKKKKVGNKSENFLLQRTCFWFTAKLFWLKRLNIKFNYLVFFFFRFDMLICFLIINVYWLFCNLATSQQWCRNKGGPGGTLAPPIFGRPVNPIPTMGGRFCPPFTSGTPNVFHLPASLLINNQNESIHTCVSHMFLNPSVDISMM